MSVPIRNLLLRIGRILAYTTLSLVVLAGGCMGIVHWQHVQYMTGYIPAEFGAVSLVADASHYGFEGGGVHFFRLDDPRMSKPEYWKPLLNRRLRGRDNIGNNTFPDYEPFAVVMEEKHHCEGRGRGLQGMIDAHNMKGAHQALLKNYRAAREARMAYGACSTNMSGWHAVLIVVPDAGLAMVAWAG